jgi:transcription elongation factor GreA
MNTTQEYISKEKKLELEQELNLLKNVKRSEIAKELERTRSLGDLSENAEYHQAREDQAYNEDRILKIEHILHNSQIITDKKGDTKSVSLGSKLSILKKGEKQEKQIEIVGGEEADTVLGKISFHSPLGNALLGKKEGDEINVSTPKGQTFYTIKKFFN